MGKPQIRTVGWPATLTKPWTSQVIALTHACFAGCNRSSDWLDLCNLTAVGPRHVQVGNDAAGLADLVARLRDTTCRLFGAPPGDGPPARRSAQAQGPSHSAPGSHLGRAVHRPIQPGIAAVGVALRAATAVLLAEMPEPGTLKPGRSAALHTSSSLANTWRRLIAKGSPPGSPSSPSCAECLSNATRCSETTGNTATHDTVAHLFPPPNRRTRCISVTPSSQISHPPVRP